MSRSTASPSDARDQLAVRAAVEDAVPFARHAGVQVVHVGADSGVARLEAAAHVLNHVGSQHAAALFLVGETAAGAALVGALLEHLTHLRFVVREADIDYLAPARTRVTAVGRLLGTTAEIRSACETTGRAHVSTAVELRDEADVPVARMTVAYHVTPIAST